MFQPYDISSNHKNKFVIFLHFYHCQFLLFLPLLKNKLLKEVFHFFWTYFFQITHFYNISLYLHIAVSLSMFSGSDILNPIMHFSAALGSHDALCTISLQFLVSHATAVINGHVLPIMLLAELTMDTTLSYSASLYVQFLVL